MAVLAESIREALPGVCVYVGRQDFEAVTGFPLPERMRTWRLSVEWDRGGRAHEASLEAREIDRLKAALPRWAEQLRERLS